ncbi:MAG: LamG domain-containing protein [Phycisphaerales bacterium]|nr:LamG domain-containing protein [Phycisphaerales bacterium]
MNTNERAAHDERRGSIYLVVLVVVAAVTTMVLVGTALRRTTAEHYRTTDDRMRARQGVRSATEAALTLMDDKDTFLTNARGGTTIMKTSSVGASTLTITVVDKDTGKVADDDTETLLVTATAETEEARSLVSFDVQILPAFLDTIVELGATSYWALDEEKNESVAVDQIGAIDGTYNKPGNVGGEDFPDDGVAPTLKGVKEAIQIPHDSSFEQEQGTIVFWARSNEPTESDQQGLIAKEDDANRELSQALFLEGGELVWRGEGKNDSLDQEFRTDASAFKDKDWHHVAYSFGLSGTRVYIDGVRVINKTSWIGLHYDIIISSATNTRPWSVGTRALGTSGAPSDPLDGSIARFVFFPKQLSDTEIADLMAAQCGAVKLEPVEGSFARVVE